MGRERLREQCECLAVMRPTNRSWSKAFISTHQVEDKDGGGWTKVIDMVSSWVVLASLCQGQK